MCDLTASRLWLISAPSMRVCLSMSGMSVARSEPARSMKDNLQSNIEIKRNDSLNNHGCLCDVLRNQLFYEKITNHDNINL